MLHLFSSKVFTFQVLHLLTVQTVTHDEDEIFGFALRHELGG